MQNRKGFTLIEVLAALAILSSALVVLLTSQQRSLNLLREQHDNEIADDLAKELITDWKLQPSYRPPSEGAFAQSPHWHWTRAEEPMADVDSNLRRITFKILKRSEQSEDQLISSYVWLEAIHAKP